ncbi:MAG: thioesterase family protein [Bacteroidota bacterium]
MFTAEIQVRVRYAETDRMGYVYYGNYATYFEVARVESLRALGFTYKGMEDSGVMLPVLELKTKFIRPARYDDLLTVKTEIRQMPGTRIHFHYEVFSSEGELLTIAETTLVFVDTANPAAYLMSWPRLTGYIFRKR